MTCVASSNGRLCGPLDFFLITGRAMGIRFQCPNGHKLNVKATLAGKRASCPECGAKLVIPLASDDAPPPAAIVVGPAQPPTAAPPAAPEPVTAAEPPPPPAVVPDLVALDAPAAEPVASDLLVGDPRRLATADYVLQRRRGKKKQLTLAMVMLVVVLVLAGVLVLVVRNSAGATSQLSTPGAQMPSTVPTLPG